LLKNKQSEKKYFRIHFPQKMDMFYRNGSKASDFYYVYNENNQKQIWSRITDKIVSTCQVPADLLLNLIQEQTTKDILLKALIQKQIVEKQISHIQKKIKNANELIANLPNPRNDLANPKYFHIMHHAKKYIYNDKFEIRSVKEIQKLHIDPKSIELAPLHIAKQFYTKRIIIEEEKLNRFLEKLKILENVVPRLSSVDGVRGILPNTETNEEYSLKEILEYQTLKQKRREEYKKEPTFWEDFLNKHIPKRGDDVLTLFQITSKKDLHKWLLIHHPDKGGDAETCQKVLAASKRAGFMH
jgi:hypothetical protein